MFFAKPVKLYNIIIAKEAFSMLTKKLLDFGGVHVEEKLPLVKVKELSPFNGQALLQRLDSLTMRVEALGKLLGFSLYDLESSKVDPFLKFPDDGLDFEKGIADLEEKIKSWEGVITKAAMLLEDKKDFIFLHEQISWFFSLLIGSGIESLYELDDTFLTWRFGNIPRDNISALQHALSEIPFSMEFSNISRNRCVMLIVTIPRYGQNLDSALHAAGFISVGLPELSSTSMLSDFEDDMEFSLWEARDEIAQVRGKLQEMSYEYYPQLGGGLKLIRMYQKVLGALSQAKSTDSTIILNAWVLKEKAVDFENLLESRFKGVLYYRKTIAEATGVEPQDVPADFPVRRFFRPFFTIVEMFGYPSYGEINPLVFVFVNMALMFGIMFADVGHGAVLFLLGLAAVMMKQEIGLLLAALGASSTLFGFVFGSVFGSEHIIHPLWVAPLENSSSVINLSILIGVVNIILGIALNLINTGRRKSWDEFWLGQWGAFSIGAYLLMISLVLPTPGIPVSWKLTALAAMLFAPVLIEAWHNKKHNKPIDFMSFIFHPFDTVLFLFSNTVSYVRIAAFTFNHAALMMVVFVLGDLMSGGGRIPMAKGAVLLLGNIFVIGLETVLSSIQCLRLNYYEFFTKFYNGNGRKFVPLKWF